jgi:uncharacterized protein YjbI with pentapeptide repeats/energy-coupling factor transporter ATP-binding protein EcfA2
MFWKKKEKKNGLVVPYREEKSLDINENPNDLSYLNSFQLYEKQRQAFIRHFEHALLQVYYYYQQSSLKIIQKRDDFNNKIKNIASHLIAQLPFGGLVIGGLKTLAAIRDHLQAKKEQESKEDVSDNLSILRLDEAPVINGSLLFQDPKLIHYLTTHLAHITCRHYEFFLTRRLAFNDVSIKQFAIVGAWRIWQKLLDETKLNSLLDIDKLAASALTDIKSEFKDDYSNHALAAQEKETNDLTAEGAYSRSAIYDAEIHQLHFGPEKGVREKEGVVTYDKKKRDEKKYHPKYGLVCYSTVEVEEYRKKYDWHSKKGPDNAQVPADWEHFLNTQYYRWVQIEEISRYAQECLSGSIRQPFWQYISKSKDVRCRPLYQGNIDWNSICEGYSRKEPGMPLDFSYVQFTGEMKGDLSGLCFEQADLSGCSFVDSTMSENNPASFCKALLHFVKAEKVNWPRVKLSQAECHFANFSEADFSDGEFLGTQWYLTQLTGIKLAKQAQISQQYIEKITEEMEALITRSAEAIETFQNTLKNLENIKDDLIKKADKAALEQIQMQLSEIIKDSVSEEDLELFESKIKSIVQNKTADLSILFEELKASVRNNYIKQQKYLTQLDWQVKEINVQLSTKADAKSVKEIQDNVNTFSRTLSRHGKNVGSLTEEIKKIKEKVSHYFESLPPEPKKIRGNGNEYLSMLLSTTVIKALNSYDRDVITKYINEKKRNELYELLSAKVGKAGIKVISDELIATRRNTRYNIDSVISQAISYNHENSIIFYLKDEENSFKGKILDLNASGGLSTLGEILSAKFTKSKRVFYLKDGSSVNVTLNQQDEICKVSVSQKREYELVQVLRGLIAVEDNSELTIQTSGPFARTNLFIEGVYTFKKVAPIVIKDKPTIAAIAQKQEKGLVARTTFKLESTVDSRFYYELSLFNCNNTEVILLTCPESYSKSQTRSFKKLDKIKDLIEYRFKFTVHAEVVGMNHEQARFDFIIKNKNTNTYETKLETMELIEKSQNKLIEMIKDNRNFLNRALNHLVCEKLAEITDSSLISEVDGIRRVLAEIGDLYKQIKIDYSPNTILKEALLSANYDDLVKKEDSVLVLKTMELLTTAFEHLEFMQGKDLIMLWGNTGSGKSTSINHLAGIKQRTTKNQFFQPIVEVDSAELEDKKINKDSYAEIGQSIGSHTAYTQGYKLVEEIEDFNSENIMLCDTPGFKDTRGAHYQLSAMLSIDQVKKVGNIKAIVLVIPYDYFIIDRGNLIVELFLDLQDKIPLAFDPRSNVCKSIFVLITKHQNYENIVITQALRSIIKSYNTEESNRMMKSPGKSYEVQNIDLQRRVAVWRMLNLMYEQRQIDFITIEDTISGGKLLEKYAKAPGIIQEQFKSVFDSYDLHALLGNYLEQSIDTWINLIMEDYLNIPAKLTEQDAIIQRNQAIIPKTNEEINQRKAAIEKYNARVHESEERIQTLKEIKQPSISISKNLKVKQEMEELLQKEVNEAIDGQLIDMQKEFAILPDTISQEEKTLKEKKGKIASLSQKITKEENDIKELNNEIKKLSEGEQDRLLWSYETKKGKEVSISVYKDGAFQRAFDEVRSLTSDDKVAGSEYKVIAGEFEGKLLHHALIDKDYYIVPEDLNERDAFLKYGHIGKYKATLVGKGYEFHLGKRVDPSGKKMVYSFITTWKKEEIPCISVTHTLLNCNINQAAINNKTTAINKIKEDYDNNKKQLEVLKKEVSDSKIETLRNRLVKLDESINEAKTIHETKISSFISVYEKIVERDSEQIHVDKQRITECNQNITDANKAIQIAKNEKEDLLNRKRRLAIVIMTQLDIAEKVNKFSELVLENQLGLNATTQKAGELLEQCTKYMAYYVDHIKDLIDSCTAELDRSYSPANASHRETRQNSPVSISSSVSAASNEAAPTNGATVVQPGCLGRLSSPSLGSSSSVTSSLVLHRNPTVATSTLSAEAKEETADIDLREEIVDSPSIMTLTHSPQTFFSGNGSNIVKNENGGLTLPPAASKNQMSK